MQLTFRICGPFVLSASSVSYCISVERNPVNGLAHTIMEHASENTGLKKFTEYYWFYMFLSLTWYPKKISIQLIWIWIIDKLETCNYIPGNSVQFHSDLCGPAILKPQANAKTIMLIGYVIADIIPSLCFDLVIKLFVRRSEPDISICQGFPFTSRAVGTRQVLTSTQ